MSALLKAFNLGRGKHKKLAEEWGEEIKEPVNDGITFYFKLLGCTPIEQASSETGTTEAIRSIITMAKASGKKLPKVALMISPTGICYKDLITGDIIYNISIYRISYCSADCTYNRVVAFVASNKNDTLECHAFLTPKRKVAQATALTISQAFTIAFEKWQVTSKKRKSSHSEQDVCTETDPNDNILIQNENEPVDFNQGCVSTLIDLSTEVQPNEADEFDDCFLKLAESRSKTSDYRNHYHHNLVLPNNLSLNNIDTIFSETKHNSFTKNANDKFVSENDLLAL